MYMLIDKIYNVKPQRMTTKQLKILAEKLAYTIALEDADFPHDYRLMTFTIYDPEYIIQFLNMLEYDVIKCNRKGVYYNT